MKNKVIVESQQVINLGLQENSLDNIKELLSEYTENIDEQKFLFQHFQSTRWSILHQSKIKEQEFKELAEFNFVGDEELIYCIKVNLDIKDLLINMFGNDNVLDIYIRFLTDQFTKMGFGVEVRNKEESNIPKILGIIFEYEIKYVPKDSKIQKPV